jgi:hypothetical protein
LPPFGFLIRAGPTGPHPKSGSRVNDLDRGGRDLAVAIAPDCGGSRNKEHPMKSLLALVTLAVTALVLEEKARQVAGDAQDAYSGAVVQAREAKRTLVQQVEQQPLISLLVAGGLAYAVASVIPARG